MVPGPSAVQVAVAVVAMAVAAFCVFVVPQGLLGITPRSMKKHEQAGVIYFWFVEES